MRESFAGHGIEVVGQEDRPLAIEALARRLEPDAVVLALEARGSRGLCERIRFAAPQTTVILWAAEENCMQVLEPGGLTIREVPDGGLAELHRELVASQSRHQE
jgi:AmiR/NasT family two-component response regulator